MTTEQQAEFLFGDIEMEGKNTHPLDKDCPCPKCNEGWNDQDLLHAVSACDNYDREIYLDPTADDPLPGLDSDRKVA